MKFTLLKVEDPKRLIKLSKSKISFFREIDDLSLFHFNKFDNNLYHLVFNVNDEYQIGTKKLGKQYNYPYSSLVNFFFLLDSKFALVEYVSREYQEEIINNINNNIKTQVKKSDLSNLLTINLINSLEGSIKKIEYTNVDDELLEKDFVTKEEFIEIAAECTIDRTLLSINNQFISLTKNGDISVDNSDEGFLIDFTKRILSNIV